ncbi:MAG TPA: CvpA family protein [Limnochordia bacterium]|nr:CvpA family protein [Limnochordia bacterium]
MNGLDLLIFIIVISFTVRGVRRGLVVEAAEGLGAAGGILLASVVGRGLGPSLALAFALPKGAGGLLLFFAVGFASAFAGVLTAQWWARTHGSGRRPLDRAGGGLFGALTAAAVCALAVAALSAVPMEWVTRLLDGSAFARAVLAHSAGLWGWLRGWTPY